MALIINEGLNNSNNGTVHIPSTENRINLEYFKTTPGILTIAQFIVGVIVIFIYPPVWLKVVAYLCCIITHLWMWIYFFNLHHKFQISIPWSVLEFYYTAGAIIAYALASLPTLITLYYTSAIFGIINTTAYGYGAYLLLNYWKEWKALNAAQQG